MCTLNKVAAALNAFGAQRVSDRMSRFPPGLQPFAVNNGFDDPNHKLQRRKYQIPVERHTNPHAGRRYDRRAAAVCRC